jgi:phosphate transport system permease protein
MGQDMSQPRLAISVPASSGGSTPTVDAGRGDISLDLRKKARLGEAVIQFFLRISGAVSIFITAGIILVLLYDAWVFFTRPEVSLWRFFTETAWQPRINQFGIFPLLNATILTSIIGLTVAMPLGLMIAIYLSEYASPKARSILKPTLEILAGIPTVVFGFFALGFMTPLIQSILGKGNVEIFNVLSAGIVIGILIIPLVSSMSEDALSAVPHALREGAYGMGATKLETAVRIVVPAAVSGLAAAAIVAMSRAVGETMVVAIAAGSGPRNFTSWQEAATNLNFLNPLRAAETMTGHIVRISGGDLSYESIEYDSIFAIAMMLFLMTFLLNLISRWVVRRFRQEY